MRFSYNFLQSFFRKKLPPPEELADKLMMHFFEVEEIEKLRGDTVIDIDVLPSRAADCFSHIGIAREISAITGMKYEKPQIRLKEGRREISDLINVTVKAACLRYTLRAVEGVKVKSSPPYIQKILKSCGIKPINNIVDITNYVMLETGQPLHAFDGEKIEGGKIVVRFAKKREKIVTLDEKRYELNDNIMVIADELSPLGIAGIKGGIVPEVDKSTNIVLLEAGNFDSKTIRKASQHLKLRTDASLRFEHGVPVEFTKEAVGRAVSLITSIAGGKALKGEVDYCQEKRKMKEVTFKAEEVRDILGVEISLKEIERILRSLEFKTKRNGNFFHIEVPYFRTDVSLKEDVIEEVGRIYGYANIKPVVPKAEITSQEESLSLKMESACRKLLCSIGFTETYNYSFINDKVASVFEYENLIEMEKPVSLEYKYLRPSLLPGLIDNIRKNEKNFEDIKIFEIGKVFSSLEDEKEKKKISGISSPADFYDLKGRINAFLEKILVPNVSYSPAPKDSFLDPYCSAEIFSGDDVIGVIGEIPPRVRKEMDIKKRTVFFEIDFAKIILLAKSVKTYDPISRFPFMTRDLAVLVPRKTTYKEVLREVKNAGGVLLRKTELFDVYEGESIPEGKKNFAFRLFFQAKNKTLSSEEANKLQEKIIKALDDKSEWKVRK